MAVWERLLQSAKSADNELRNNKLTEVLLQYRNTPDTLSLASPAEIPFGRHFLSIYKSGAISNDQWGKIVKSWEPAWDQYFRPAPLPFFYLLRMADMYVKALDHGHR